MVVSSRLMSSSNNEDSSKVVSYVSVGPDQGNHDVPSDIFMHKDFEVIRASEQQQPKEEEPSEEQKHETELSRKHYELTSALPWRYHQIMNHLRAITQNTKEHISLLEAESNKEKKGYNKIAYNDYLDKDNSDLRQFISEWKADKADRQLIDKLCNLYDRLETEKRDRKKREEERRYMQHLKDVEHQRKVQEEIDAEDRLAAHFSMGYHNELKRLRAQREGQQ
jgi:hypothetical protein